MMRHGTGDGHRTLSSSGSWGDISVAVPGRHDRQAMWPVAEFLLLGRPLGLANAPTRGSGRAGMRWTPMTLPSRDSCTRPSHDGHVDGLASPPAEGSRVRRLLCLVDAGTAFPGIVLPPWPPAVAGEPYTPPADRRIPRLAGKAGSGRCPACAAFTAM